MKNKNLLLLGSIVTVSALAVALINPVASVNGVYSPRKAEMADTHADDAMEYFKNKRLSPTGVYDEAWLKQSRDLILAEIEFQHRASNLVWMEEGPDNVGGRTRAICIDRNDANHVFAGSVSGGLFVSNNGGNTWTIVPGFDQYLRISSMCQTLNGTYYVGTGCSFDNWGSDGIFTSTDGGVTWTQIATSNLYSNVNELQADPVISDKIWIAGQHSSAGFQTYSPGGGFSGVPSGLTSGTYQDVKISPDGQYIACVKVQSGTQVYVSTDGGSSFSNVSGGGAGQVTTSGTRKELAVSFEKNSDNKWTFYCSSSQSDLRDVSVSEDNGLTWNNIAPSNSVQNTFHPFQISTTSGGQGYYDHILAGVPGRPDHVMLGGTEIYKWYRSSTANPVYGTWEQKATWIGSNTSPSFLYCHADEHEMEWDQNDFLYVGNDGGVFKSYDKGESVWVPHNRGYNVTQFYSVAYSKYGHSMGGAQDNGTLYKNFTGSTQMEYQEVHGGDGFDCDISHINPDVMFATVYNQDYNRSDDEGNSFSFFGPINSGPQFFSVGRLYENPNDLLSQDSLDYIANTDYNAGDTIYFTSRTQQVQVPLILTAPLNEDDTLRVQDPVQSLYGVGASGTYGIWITRHALRFNVTPTWKKVISNAGGSVNAIEFGTSGDVMFVGTSNGTLHIIKNLSSFYSPANDISNLVITTITGFGNIEGIGVDPQDDDHIIVCGNNTVKETSSATTATSTSAFSDITTSLTPLPTYDGIIDHLDPNIMVIGTEYGAYSTNDGGTTWTYQPELGLVPVNAVRQQWRSDSWNKGVVYCGTFGRGIWSSASLVGVNEPDATAVAHNFFTEIKTFPNPMNNNGTISFNVKERGNVDVQLMDLTGRVVMTKNLGTLNQGENYTKIDVSRLAAGTYIVTVISGEHIGTDKLIVTH